MADNNKEPKTTDQNYSHLIDDVIPQVKSRILVKKMIPILIRWAKQGLAKKTYNDMIKELGYTKYSGIGRQLGNIDSVFKFFTKVSGETIPTLNSLCKKQKTMLPSDGFKVVYSTYPNMSVSEKHIFVMGLDKRAIEYDHWDWVMKSLGLTPSEVNTEESEMLIRSGSLYGKGGEGDGHKKMKEYIFNHPESIKIRNVTEKSMEHILLSGDRLDVVFKKKDGSCFAIEVKPSSSPDADIMRGLYQCVKYKTIMDAEDKVHGKKGCNTAILVIGNSLSTENQIVRDVLGVTVIENFII